MDMDIGKVKNAKPKKKNGNKGVSRKNNPDYEKQVVMSRDGVKQSVYRKKNKNKGKNVGTPAKRRGAFKTPKLGALAVPPTIASTMAKPIGNYNQQQLAKKALFTQDYLERLSGDTREKIQNEYKAPTQVAKIKKRSRPDTGVGGDGRT
jgi:hypothetical protein